MTLTNNYYYKGPALPGDTVAPAEYNVFKDIRRINATADVASLLTAGTLCYLTGTTQASDMTPTVTEMGDVDAQYGLICVVEIEKHNPQYATTTDLAVWPNKMPNTTVTRANYSPAAETKIIVIPLEEGMNIWILGSQDGSFDTTFGTCYIAAANGYIKATGAPTGATPDKNAQTFMSLATTTNQNWTFCRYLGVRMYDSS